MQLLTLEEIQDYFPSCVVNMGPSLAWFVEDGIEKHYISFQLGWQELKPRKEGSEFDIWFRHQEIAVNAFKQAFRNYSHNKNRLVFRKLPTLVCNELQDPWDGRVVKEYQVSCRFYAE